MIACGMGALLLVASNVFLGRAVSHAPLLDEVRVPVWQSTVQMIADRPWLGVGLDGFRFVYPRYMRVEAWTEPLLYHPHNAWLDAAVRMGLPGAILFAVLIASCVRGAVRWSQSARGPQRAIAVGCLASLLAALAHGMVDSGYFMADLAWSLGLVAGIVASNVGLNAEPVSLLPCVKV
jgi:putative inorganic carbon (HCO3(-)) transporter